MDILSFIQQQHRAQIADAFVCETWTGGQFQAFQLTEMRRIAEHVNVQQFGNIPASPYRILLAECAANVGAFFVDDSSLFGRCSGGTNLSD